MRIMPRMARTRMKAMERVNIVEQILEGERRRALGRVSSSANHVNLLTKNRSGSAESVKKCDV